MESFVCIYIDAPDRLSYLAYLFSTLIQLLNRQIPSISNAYRLYLCCLLFKQCLVVPLSRVERFVGFHTYVCSRRSFRVPVS